MPAKHQFPPAPPPTAAAPTCLDERENLDYEMICNWAKLSMETMADRLERYIDYFSPSVETIQRMAQSFTHELKLGLDMHLANPLRWNRQACSFKMLDSCIPHLPSGKEKGVFYALDFGGTNFRVVRAALSGSGKVKISQFKQSLMDAKGINLKKGLMDSQSSATNMFDFFAAACKELMQQEGDLKEGDSSSLATGFTFSFPCTQRRLNSAHLMEWTKGFETGRATNDPVEGMDVAELMNAGFQRFGVPLHVAAVLNDTVGTLLAASYEIADDKPKCLIGLILGTGVNACYYESRAKDYGYSGNIINLECGNFNRDLPLTNVDLELDFAESSNRGRQRLEKMVAGAYLGEITRRAIVKVLQNHAPAPVWVPFSLTSEHISRIIEDSSTDFSTTATVLMDVWRHLFSPSELEAIHRLATAVIDRAAALSAVIIAGTARQTGHLQRAMGGCSVAIDGSLYKMVPIFQRNLKSHLISILGADTASLLNLTITGDGSGKGAAVLAGALSSRS